MQGRELSPVGMFLLALMHDSREVTLYDLMSEANLSPGASLVPLRMLSRRRLVERREKNPKTYLYRITLEGKQVLEDGWVAYLTGPPPKDAVEALRTAWLPLVLKKNDVAGQYLLQAAQIRRKASAHLAEAGHPSSRSFMDKYNSAYRKIKAASLAAEAEALEELASDLASKAGK